MGCPSSLGSYSDFSTDNSISRQIHHVFNVRVHERALMMPKIMRSKDAQCNAGE